jgi:hypothetical protein
MRRTTLLCAVLLYATTPGAAQPAPSLQQLLERMWAYLAVYETQLSSVVADERFDQRVTSSSRAEEAEVRFGEAGAVGAPGGPTAANRSERRTLDSEVAFIRLPGGAEWLGFRDVRRANDKNVAAGGLSISEVLTATAADVQKARAIAQASAQHNLGLPRTINVPTAPLDIIHPLHRAAHKYEIDGRERVGSTPTVIVRFRELARPTLLKEPSGRDLISSGRVWVAPDTGAVWRVEWTYQGTGRRSGPAPSLRVDFAPHDLGFMVPTTMAEVFSAPGGHGEGRATYTNFRRFGTSARIVPQQP